MRKILLVLVVVFSALQAFSFVPSNGVYYNIIQNISQRVIGQNGTQPVVQDVDNSKAQAFQFILVDGKTDTYYLKSAAGKYLNMLVDPNQTWNTWTSVYEDVINGLYSEWVVVTEGDNFRLMLNANQKYLASDQTGQNSSLYTDKTLTNANGLFSAAEAMVNTESFKLSEHNLLLKIETNGKTYPLTIYSEGFTDDIVIVPSSGFDCNIKTITPLDLQLNLGQVNVKLSTSAPAGTQGKIYFTLNMGGEIVVFDSIYVEAVAPFKRYSIANNTANGLVVGNQANTNVPALVEPVTGDPTQQFILRPVNEGVNDSLFYIIQDDNYRFLTKVPSSGWDVEYGFSGDEAKWKLKEETQGIWSITNFVTGKATGTDDITVGSRLYDDKQFISNPTSKPYSEWVISEVGSQPDQITSKLKGFKLSTGVSLTQFNPDSLVYKIYLPADQSSVSIEPILKSSAEILDKSIIVLSSDNVSETIKCTSGDNGSTTSYTFSIEYVYFNDSWKAMNLKDAVNTYPNQWGWSCTNASWQPANSTVPGTVRYNDNTGYLNNGEAWSGRVMYMRWDGNVTNSGIYSYPILMPQVTDAWGLLNGKIAWNSIIADKTVTSNTFTIQVNSEKDNSGISAGMTTVHIDSLDLRNLHSFEIPKFYVSGYADQNLSRIYYLNITSSTAVMAGIADLSFSLLSNVEKPKDREVKMARTANGLLLMGTEPGEMVRIYNINGQMISTFEATSTSADVSIEQNGVYLVNVAGKTYKFLK